MLCKVFFKKREWSGKAMHYEISYRCHNQEEGFEKVVPTIKAVDYQRADYRRAITTSSRNRQSNSTMKRNIKLQLPKCQPKS